MFGFFEGFIHCWITVLNFSPRYFSINKVSGQKEQGWNNLYLLRAVEIKTHASAFICRCGGQVVQHKQDVFTARRLWDEVFNVVSHHNFFKITNHPQAWVLWFLEENSAHLELKAGWKRKDLRWNSRQEQLWTPRLQQSQCVQLVLNSHWWLGCICYILSTTESTQPYLITVCWLQRAYLPTGVIKGMLSDLC